MAASAADGAIDRSPWLEIEEPAQLDLGRSQRIVGGCHVLPQRLEDNLGLAPQTHIGRRRGHPHQKPPAEKDQGPCDRAVRHNGLLSRDRTMRNQPVAFAYVLPLAVGCLVHDDPAGLSTTWAVPCGP